MFEDSRGVVGDNVDAAELLHEHDDERAEGGATIARDGEEFEDAKPAGGLDFLLGLEQCVDVWRLVSTNVFY